MTLIEQSIIFFDIDGTLLNRQKQLPESAKQAIMELKAKGHMVSIATGRAPFMFETLREELDIHTYVCYNGQYVVLNGDVLHTTPLNNKALEKLTETALHNNHPVVFMDHEDMKANISEHSFIQGSFNTLKLSRFPKYDPDYYKGRRLYQLLLFCEEDEEKQYEQSFDAFDFIRWHPMSVDVLPKGGSKAKGIEQIVQKLGIPSENQYAFGDGLNDLEMLSSVKNSVAMGNANERVKQMAKYITKTVDEEGIRHGLQMVGLL